MAVNVGGICWSCCFVEVVHRSDRMGGTGLLGQVGGLVVIGRGMLGNFRQASKDFGRGRVGFSGTCVSTSLDSHGFQVAASVLQASAAAYNCPGCLYIRLGGWTRGVRIFGYSELRNFGSEARDFFLHPVPLWIEPLCEPHRGYNVSSGLPCVAVLHLS